MPDSRVLPLQGASTFSDGCLTLRLPVRAEHVSVQKEVVIRERVRVKRHRVEDVARVQANLRREVLRTAREGRSPPAESTRFSEI
jgi:uncharacterized protein (TIGR02271 family)